MGKLDLGPGLRQIGRATFSFFQQSSTHMLTTQSLSLAWLSARVGCAAGWEGGGAQVEVHTAQWDRASTSDNEHYILLSYSGDAEQALSVDVSIIEHLLVVSSAAPSWRLGCSALG